MIKASEMIELTRSIIAEDDPTPEGFFKPAHIRMWLNAGLKYVFGYCMNGTEALFLRGTQLPGTEATTDGSTTTFTLPDDTIYVSNYNDDIYRIDLRPTLFPVGTVSQKMPLINNFNCYITDKQIIIINDLGNVFGDPSNFALLLNYKVVPQIKNDTDVLDVHTILQEPIVDYAIRYARRRDERADIDSMLKEQLRQARALLINMSGQPLYWRTYWDVPLYPSYWNYDRLHIREFG